tara:strand:- start:391 stop:558 length:168 start_codon:yes stop_codon:yes gene_type:complete
MDDNVGSKNTWVQRLNFIKIFVNLYQKYLGLDLKILAYMGLLIYWATILLAPFSH